MDHLTTVLRYHEATKHHFGRFARSLGYLDWATQPAPFRRFAGCATHPLPLPPGAPGPDWDTLGSEPRPVRPLDADSLGHFFYHSLALSSWKEVVSPQGEVVSRWALRVNPSSGNLHPTEAYLLAEEIPGLGNAPGALHYAPDEHLLEQRITWPAAPSRVPQGCFLVVLNSIPWREMWKYGERAFRYCQHDVGHALLCLSAAAACLGWRATLVPGVSPGALERLCGADRQTGPEREYGDCLVLIGPGPADEVIVASLPAMLDELAQGQDGTPCHGTPNTLSAQHQNWPLVDQVLAASSAPVVSDGAGSARTATGESARAEEAASRQRDALELIRERRSAVAMDGRSAMSAADFQRLCRALLPGHPLLEGIMATRPQVSLLLFVHKVEGLEPGLYLLERHPGHLAELREAAESEVNWHPVEGTDLPLHRLVSADCRAAAGRLSCGQQIAAEGALAVGMLARFAPSLKEYGPGFYRQLFWETGAIGQLLYLEAEAAGLRGTGIGCFFDDEVHRLLGLQDDTWQSLYHFTLGGPVPDLRLRSAEPYSHLDGGGDGS